MYRYDLASDVWDTVASLLTGKYDIGAGVINGKIYAIGGKTASGDVYTVEEYDPGADNWKLVDSLTHNRSELGAGVVNTHVGDFFRLAHSIQSSGAPALFGSLSLAQVRIHDGVLSDADVLNNFNEGPTAQIPEPAVALLLPLAGLVYFSRRRR